jgi:hypothetical protein
MGNEMRSNYVYDHRQGEIGLAVVRVCSVDDAKEVPVTSRKDLD